MKKTVLDQRTGQEIIPTNRDLCRDALLFFANSDLFGDNETRYEDRFYGRRFRPHVLKHLDFSIPASRFSIGDYACLAANRLLFTMNEVDFLMLPKENFNVDHFKERYNSSRSMQAAIAMPHLERFLFSFLDDEITLSEHWDFATVKAYFEAFAEDDRSRISSAAIDAIAASDDHATAARDWLIQLAPDFLIESSPMARYASGNYGEISSTLFKILIDELGYGEQSRRHSTLYERTLASVGLVSEPHHYWQYYLNGSLLLANYYNYITRNRSMVFRYIGAIFLAETTFIRSCGIWRKYLKGVLPDMDATYFGEHCHIDVDHSRMALEGLVYPAIQRYGTFAAREIVRGFEEARLVADIAEADFVDQQVWKGRSSSYQAVFSKIFGRVSRACDEGQVQRADLDEEIGELSITHSHDGDELCHVSSGTLEFINGFEQSTVLNAGEGIIIERNRLHGALVRSSRCQYHIYSIKDLKSWL